MVKFIDLDISQLHKIIRVYKLETQIIPPKKKITQLSKAELVAEIEKHLELKDDKIYFKHNTNNFVIPKASKPRPVNPDAPIRPKKPSKSEIIETLMKRVEELEKIIADYEKGKPLLRKEGPVEPTPRPLPKPKKEKKLKPTEFIKQEPKKTEKLLPEIDFETVRKKVYSVAKKMNSKQYIELLKNNDLMKETKRIYNSGDMPQIIQLIDNKLKTEKDHDKKMNLLYRSWIYKIFLMTYEKLLKNPKIKDSEIIVRF